MRGEFGDGDDRRANLGTRYDEVQSFINHIYEASANDLANEVLSGKYGNGDTRKAVLGDRYSEVQGIVNGEAEKEYYTIQSGDVLSKSPLLMALLLIILYVLMVLAIRI